MSEGLSGAWRPLGAAAALTAWYLLGCAAPAAAAAAGAERLYVSDERGGNVVIVDPRRARVVASIPVGKRPRAS